MLLRRYHDEVKRDAKREAEQRDTEGYEVEKKQEARKPTKSKK